MIKTALLLACIFLMIAPARAQQSNELNWEPFRFLLGEWIGEGSGKPGEATGGFSFSFDLEKEILVRKNYANYPATKDKPAYSHTDLMIIYQETATNVTRAVYFDNEGQSSTTQSHSQTTIPGLCLPASLPHPRPDFVSPTTSPTMDG